MKGMIIFWACPSQPLGREAYASRGRVIRS
jgi:hypothetical protein